MSETQSQTLSASEAHARGHALVDAGRFDEAMDAYRTVMALAPRPDSGPNELAIVCNEVASRLRANGRSRESITWCQRAIQAAPESAELHTNLGAAWMEIGGAKEARASLQRAIELNPDFAIAYSNLATLLHKAGELQQALPLYRRAAELEPEFIYPRVQALSLARELSQWSDWYEDLEALRTLTPTPENTAPQLDLLYLPLAPMQLRHHAEAFAANMMPHETATASMPVDVGASAVAIAPTSANAVLATDLISRTHSPSPPLLVRRPPRGNRIRVGYVSDELRRHATGSLMAELLELHDKRRFDVHLYTWGHLDGSVVERRISRAASGIHDIGGLSNRSAAELIASDGIDILVDLKGYTLKPRTEIFALRPAPVQVSWLGFPGTLGAACYDYLIADDFIVPPGSEPFYIEQVVRLPATYQPNDRRRPIGSPKSRAGYGLPSEGVVFCYLGKSGKITPDVFDDWMIILRETPGSVLWLFADRSDARINLLSEANKRGIDIDRLRFADTAPFADHIARFRVADLALDTFPYGSHTTASEALWAGCPIVTRVGDTFASRVAGSLLRAAGCPGLITTSAAEFRERAIALGNNPSQITALRKQLEQSRDSCSLFDTPRFARDLEAAYETMLSAVPSRK